MWIPKGAELIIGRHLSEARRLLEEIQQFEFRLLEEIQQIRNTSAYNFLSVYVRLICSL